MLEVGKWPDEAGWSERFALTAGGCNRQLHELAEAERPQVVLNLALHVLMDGVPPDLVVREFRKVRLFAEAGIRLPGGWYRSVLFGGRWDPHV